MSIWKLSIFIQRTEQWTLTHEGLKQYCLYSHKQITAKRTSKNMAKHLKVEISTKKKKIKQPSAFSDSINFSHLA